MVTLSNHFKITLNVFYYHFTMTDIMSKINIPHVKYTMCKKCIIDKIYTDVHIVSLLDQTLVYPSLRL